MDAFAELGGSYPGAVLLMKLFCAVVAGHVPAWSRPSETSCAFLLLCQKLHNEQSKVQRPRYERGLWFLRKLTPNKEGYGLKIP